MNITLTESRRVLRQLQLDEVKTHAERNKLGQFATPTALAADITKYARMLLPTNPKIRFLDPAFGTGAFYSALLQQFPVSQIVEAVGYEVDSHYGNEAIKLWRETPLKLNITDFTQAIPPNSDWAKANLLICNPPYVRHHHLSRIDKLRLQRVTEEIAGIKLSQLASLYCHFLCMSDAWMAPDGLAGWLIPTGFMDVNYGQPIKDYLLNRVTLLRIHCFDPADVQFEDALCTSAVVWFKKALPPTNHVVEFTYQGSLTEPKMFRMMSVKSLRQTAKWTKFRLVSGGVNSPEQPLKLSDLFTIKRGLATGANVFFVLTPEQVYAYKLPFEFLKPVLPSPRFLGVDEIEADSLGNPILENPLFLLSCDLPPDEVKAKYPMLWDYLQRGVKQGIRDRYLCKHRSPWFSQEKRPSSPFLCTYMGRQDSGRGRPFRFILNHSRATATNVYLMLYPKSALAKALLDKPELHKQVWQALNQISAQALMGEGRVYGGGLHKLEPRELGNALFLTNLNITLTKNCL
ncbi:MULTISPECIES: Eco57I restriction-modification methylase domain-containing protein [unclassified Coleofasciculus]|uniref:Eco57I restriction-modification methylase domain-containing protein n=1 Tax=unclassified Coleofasciculus TaxID=2692782 RepID=UPI0018811B87|nr:MULTISPECIES: SAM-dependent DNA methyltransferase [unclassified Coleofasciculus]MBE9129114.1 SAM-dependent DNA methyltransferase [Coleofasciculus sp. LEGE 07081]MBE9149841.1 SAM-dependent DNA methyltransferase [Coleofasciculus sp. LEGE 07092]